MGILSAIALPLTLLEYYFTKERVTEEQAASGEKKIPFFTQLKIILTDKYMIVMFVFIIAIAKNASKEIRANVKGIATFGLQYFFVYG